MVRLGEAAVVHLVDAVDLEEMAAEAVAAGVALEEALEAVVDLVVVEVVAAAAAADSEVVEVVVVADFVAHSLYTALKKSIFLWSSLRVPSASVSGQ